MEESTNNSEWGKCSVIDCPIPGTAKQEGNNCVCTYHLGEERDMHSEITRSVKSHIQIHNKLCEMVYWTPLDWKKKWPLIQNWDFCPLDPKEVHLPHIYLERLRKKLAESVKSKAIEMSNNAQW